MKTFARTAVLGVLVSAVSTILVASGPPSTVIRKVSLLGTGNNVEIEVSASQPVNPQAQVLSNPNRLVLDFPNASMASGLRGFNSPRGPVNGVRVGILTNNPPVTRVVVDLNTPRGYRLFPSGNNVIVKLNNPDAADWFETEFEVVADSPMPQAPVPPPAPAPKVQVRYDGGQLSITANKATLAEVLFEIQRKTGADIPIPAGAAADQVVTNIGPVPPGAALAALLNGSPFNFIMVGSDQTPSQLRSVLIFPKGGTPPQVGNSTPQLTPRPAAPQDANPGNDGGAVFNASPPINENTGLPEEPQPDETPQPEQPSPQ